STTSRRLSSPRKTTSVTRMPFDHRVNPEVQGAGVTARGGRIGWWADIQNRASPLPERSRHESARLEVSRVLAERGTPTDQRRHMFNSPRLKVATVAESRALHSDHKTRANRCYTRHR